MSSYIEDMMEEAEYKSLLTKFGFNNLQIPEGDVVATKAANILGGEKRMQLDAEQDDPSIGENIEVFGVSLKEVGDTLDELPQGIAEGAAKFLANTAAFTGVIKQEDADIFSKRLDELAEERTADNLAAKGVNIGVNIGTQLITPILGVRKALVNKGMNPLFASLFADTVIPAVALSPNDESLINQLIAENPDEQSRTALENIREIIGTDPDDPDYVNRLRHATEGLALFGLTEVAIRGIIQGVKGVRQFLKTNTGKMAAGAAGIGVGELALSPETKAKPKSKKRKKSK